MTAIVCSSDSILTRTPANKANGLLTAKGIFRAGFPRPNATDETNSPAIREGGNEEKGQLQEAAEWETPEVRVLLDPISTRI